MKREITKKICKIITLKIKSSYATAKRLNAKNSIVSAFKQVLFAMISVIAVIVRIRQRVYRYKELEKKKT